ncbi:MAG: AMP-binding protein [Thermodesulfobacteriota bacterium]
MIITEILARNGRMYKNDVALVEREPERNRRGLLTWSEFDRMSDRLAAALAALGIQKGDRVAQLMMNCLSFLPVYFGILRAGAVACPLNFRFSAEDIRYCISTAEAKALIFGPEFTERIREAKVLLDNHVGTYIYCGDRPLCPEFAIHIDDFLAGRLPLPEVEMSLGDPAGIYFTSGTTGRPKATLLTHRNLEFSCFLENRHHNQTRSDNFLCIPPLYHAGAKMHWFGNFIVGARAVILKGVSPEWILEAVSEEQATVVWLLVPWALDILFAIRSGEVKLSDYKLDQWRLMHIGAQPVPPSLVKEWRKVFPNQQYDTNYGLTESTGPGCVHLGVENTHKVGAIGVPGFDWEYKIVDGEEKPVAPGQPGELCVRGPGVMTGYYKNPEATAATLRDGWLMTGDIARVDEDGFLWLVDRKKDVIIMGGENIYPVEIENFLHAHPKVADAAVIGIPNLRLGEIPAAIIRIKEDEKLSEEEILAFCEDLPRYKRPRRIFFGEVPRNPTGKIEKPKLRARYGGKEQSV